MYNNIKYLTVFGRHCALWRHLIDSTKGHLVFDDLLPIKFYISLRKWKQSREVRKPGEHSFIYLHLHLFSFLLSESQGGGTSQKVSFPGTDLLIFLKRWLLPVPSELQIRDPAIGRLSYLPDSVDVYMEINPILQVEWTFETALYWTNQWLFLSKIALPQSSVEIIALKKCSCDGILTICINDLTIFAFFNWKLTNLKCLSMFVMVLPSMCVLWPIIMANVFSQKVRRE